MTNNPETIETIETIDGVEAPKPARKPRRRKPTTVTIRGRVATTSLPVGETTTVERTPHIDALLARGYVEVV